MNTEERLKILPAGVKRINIYLEKSKLPGKMIYIFTSLLATFWFLFRVIQKPTRAAYPCMQIAAPIISGFVIWILTLSGTIITYRKAKQKLIQDKYVAALLFFLLCISAVFFLLTKSAADTHAMAPETWYKANVPAGEAKGIFPGRVAWGHNPKIATWDGITGFWWEDKFNNQEETDKLVSQTLLSLTSGQTEKAAWDTLFKFFNKSKHNKAHRYKAGEKIAIKINENNTSAHENTDEINANPQLILSLLKSLIKEGGVPQEAITITDPSRFITNNIFDKCHAIFPKVHFVDHNGGDGREKATFIPDAIPYSVDNGGVCKGIATCVMEADYIINLALMKGHVSQGVTLCGKNYFGCTSIETDWRKNAHSAGFSQDRNGKRTYSVYTDYLGHKELGAKTMLFLIDGIYSNKFVAGVPASRWSLTPFNNGWPCSLFASQDGVAIDAVVLDFALTEWPDAPDMKYSDYYLEESALAGNPPSGVKYDPERDGTTLKRLGVTEHWNNAKDKQYSRNLKTGDGIELIYNLIGK